MIFSTLVYLQNLQLMTTNILKLHAQKSGYPLTLYTY